MLRCLALLLVLASAPLGAQQLPPGPGADVLKSRCLGCHEADIVTSQKLSLTGWTNSVAKMIRWGAQITPQERELLQPYLAAHFSPRPAVSHPSSPPQAPALSAVEGTYKTRCLTCHDADIIEQQKLSRIGWTRSVEKMMRWGAAIGDADKEPLVDYLFSRFPPQ